MNQNVASTIIEQLGGARKMSAMIGVKSILTSDDGVIIKFANARGLNMVEITLDASDTYTVKFGRLVKYDVSWKPEVSGVYADSLRRLFETSTGLYLSL